MDVKYIPGDWEKMRNGIGDLIGLGRWGKGMIDSLKDLSDNLEDIESAIANYDSDGVISFNHTSQKNKYQGLYEDFQVLHRFAGKVGDIVDGTIDQPFYKDMDAFVSEMRDLSISTYTTQNRLGIKVNVAPSNGLGLTEKVEKPTVSLDDLFNGDNFYGKQMKLEYEAWKKLNPNQDFSQQQYQQEALNNRAFEYHSIRDQQDKKEFRAQMIALAVIVGATVICPPAGLALGLVYGSLELGSAVSGKDWASGRELGTGERWFRGLLSPLDIIPGVSGLAKFSSAVRFANLNKNIGRLGLETGFKASVKREVTHIGDMVHEAGKISASRLKSAEAVMKRGSNAMINKVARDTIEAGRVADTGITFVKNMIPSRKRLIVTSNGQKVYMPVENTHAVENKLRGMYNKIGINTEEGIIKGSDDFSVSPPVNVGNPLEANEIVKNFAEEIDRHPNKEAVKEVLLYVINKQNSINTTILLDSETIRKVLDSVGPDITRSELQSLKDKVINDASVKLRDKLTPSQKARLWQGSEPYFGLDDYEDIVLKNGGKVYAGYPFPTGYSFSKDVLNSIDGNAKELFQGVQVNPRIMKDGTGEYKFQVIGFELLDDLPSARGMTTANPQLGKGGLEQIFTPEFKLLVREGKVKPILEKQTMVKLREKGIEFDPKLLQQVDKNGDYVYKSICDTFELIVEDSNVIKLENYRLNEIEVEKIKKAVKIIGDNGGGIQ